jgi:alpha-L-fucosidase
MEDRLIGMGKWLDLYGEAIYGTQAWKQSRQWSKGTMPTIDGGNYQTNYDITQLVKPNDKTAHIEMFFTQKGKTIYAIVPRYSPKVTIQDISAVQGLKVSIPGLNKNIPYTVNKTGIVVDLSGLKPGDLPYGIFVVKVENGMK